jgi:hypothetical protein
MNCNPNCNRADPQRPKVTCWCVLSSLVYEPRDSDLRHFAWSLECSLPWAVDLPTSRGAVMSPVCGVVFDSCISIGQSALTSSLRHAAVTACLQSSARVSSIVYGLASAFPGSA